MKRLIVDIEKYVIDYCTRHNYNITFNYIFNIRYNNLINKEDIFVFKINYNQYNYLYKIKINNNDILFSIKLKNNMKRQIIMHDKHDFDKLVIYMINDNKKNND